MNFFTHIAMGKSLYKKLKHAFPLMESAFIYGNIKPDLEHLVPHLYQTHHDYVMAQVAELQNFEGTLERFSETLGEVCHYVCDFFCLYHRDTHYYHRYLKHFIYEAKTHVAFVLRKWQHKVDHIPCDLGDFEQSLMHIRTHYLESAQGVNNDLYYAMETAYKLIYEICLCNQSRFFLVFWSNHEMNV